MEVNHGSQDVQKGADLFFLLNAVCVCGLNITITCSDFVMIDILYTFVTVN